MYYYNVCIRKIITILCLTLNFKMDFNEAVKKALNTKVINDKKRWQKLQIKQEREENFNIIGF